MLEGKLQQKEIAKEIGVSEQTIINWKKDERFKELKFKMERESIQGLVVDAINTLHELLSSESDTVRFYASRDILDRAGHKQRDEHKIEVDSKQEVTITENPLKGLTTEELKRLADANEDN